MSVNKVRNRAVQALTAAVVVGLAWCLCLTDVRPARSQEKKTNPAARPRAVRFSPLDLREIETLEASNPATIPSHLSLGNSGDGVYIPLQIEFRDSAARRRFRAPEGVTVYHEFGRFADAFLDVHSRNSLDDIQAMEGVVWVDADTHTVRVPPPPRIQESREKPRGVEKTLRGGFQGLTGKGVIVAVIDDGIDFRHKDFTTTDKEGRPVSRLLAYWDTFARQKPDGKIGKPAPFKYPNGSPIGMIYSQEDLTSELRQWTGQATTGGSHGTPCLGLAAGNGSSRPDKRYAGVAPEADLIAVRIGQMGPWNQFLMGAVCAWIDERAGAKPVVISCSFGHAQQGGRDGFRVTERQLDARFHAGRKGRAICIAAGNEAQTLGFGRASYHASTTFRGDDNRGSLSWVSATRTGRVTVYVNTDAPDDVDYEVKATPQPEVHRYVHPLSKATVIEVGLRSATGGPQPGQIDLWSKSRTRMRADAYIDTEPWNQGAFQGSSVSKTGLLRTPGTMTGALTVGSYDFNAIDDRSGTPRVLQDPYGRPMQLGDLSSYTSPGYLRTGVVKPTVVSPGQYHITPTSGSTANYTLFNGTSAATPYTAGVVALLYQKKPDLTFGVLKALFRQHATTNEVTGRTPNPQWGYGKFDYQAALAVFKAVEN